MPKQNSLPITPLLPKICSTLQNHKTLVLQAPTGSGKTTRVPRAFLPSLPPSTHILLLEPRRIAARAAARYIARQERVPIGQTIGYHVRFDRKASAETQLLVVTPGIYLQMLQRDPFLEDTAIVIFDEFHERSTQLDLALAMTRQVQQDANPELQLLVMSATLETEKIATYLDNCPVIQSEGRSYPVAIQYTQMTDTSNEPIHKLATEGVRRIAAQEDGDILVFLPGWGEIQRTQNALQNWAERNSAMLLPLHGDLPHEEQDQALAPQTQRKVILSTNVAETSLTIPGIRIVVDTGWARVLRYDPWTGLNRLLLERISLASAEQRKGRAGREQPGFCLRLWNQFEHQKLRESEEPELLRTDLTEAVLQLWLWGESDPNQFSWLEAPTSQVLQQAQEQLQRLGAWGPHGLTPNGKAMAQLPLPPRLARLLLAGQELQCESQAALLAAYLSERSPFRLQRHTATATLSRSIDILDRLQLLLDFESTQRPPQELHLPSARHLFRVRDKLQRILHQLPQPQTRFSTSPTSSSATQTTSETPLRKAILSAYADKIACKRPQDPTRALLIDGSGVAIEQTCGELATSLFVCLQTQPAERGKRREPTVQVASIVDPKWLPEDAIQIRHVVEFDTQRERVMTFERRQIGALLLHEAPTQSSDPNEVTACLAQAALLELDKALPLKDKHVQQFLERVRCLAHWMPELQLPEFGQEDWKEILPNLCYGKRSFAELRKLPLLDFLKSQLNYQQQKVLDQEAPERLQVPSGSRIQLQYQVGHPPILAVRIQELFGLVETPKVAHQRIPVRLHLLAPNMRPQQITEDLTSFWNNTYPEVRKELRQRYPKHAWPEDPWNATAERRPQRKKKKTT